MPGAIGPTTMLPECSASTGMAIALSTGIAASRDLISDSTPQGRKTFVLFLLVAAHEIYANVVYVIGRLAHPRALVM